MFKSAQAIKGSRSPRRRFALAAPVCVLLTAISMLISPGAHSANSASRTGSEANSPTTLVSQIQTPTPSPTPNLNTITFGNNTMADFSATSGEPIIKVDKQDRIFVTTPFGLSTTISMLWRSDDGGRSYLPLGPPVLRDAVLATRRRRFRRRLRRHEPRLLH